MHLSATEAFNTLHKRENTLNNQFKLYEGANIPRILNFSFNGQVNEV